MLWISLLLTIPTLVLSLILPTQTGSMFDVLLQNPLVLILPNVVSVVFAFLLSRAIELVPKFARWWDAQPDNYKIAYRGWSGLAISIIVVLFVYFAGLTQIPLHTLADWLIFIAATLISWLLYVGSAEATYQLTKETLPRKLPNWRA